MKSFGLWYKGKNDTNKENGKDPIFSVHINFWSESVKHDNSIPSLDVGIKIKSFRNVNEVVFHCPFIVENDSLTDLIPKLCKLENADIIFNTSGKIQAEDKYSTYSFTKNEHSENLLLFPLKQNVGTMYSLSEDVDKSDIVFDISRLNKYLGQKGKFSNIDEIYLRFRISSAKLKKNIYFDCEPYNKSFESAFSGTRIFDFKINEKRNLSPEKMTKMDMEQYKFCEIDDIHLLLMEPSSYDVESFADTQMTCRELENDIWNDYLDLTADTNLDYSKGRILAYHWKFEKGCSCLIKVKYSKTNLKTLSAYILIALSIGVVGSTIVAMVQAICEVKSVNFSWWAYGVGAVLFVIGVFLGKTK